MSVLERCAVIYVVLHLAYHAARWWARGLDVWRGVPWPEPRRTPEPTRLRLVRPVYDFEAEGREGRWR